MNTEVMFSSKSNDWATPIDFFEKVQKELGNFDLDPASDGKNNKAPIYFTESDNGLSKDWFGRVWLNPPYGRTLGKWVKKCSEEINREGGGVLSICLLIPARTDTSYFHKYIYQKPGVEIIFLRGRLKFGTDEYWAWVWEQEYINGKKNTLFKKYGRKNPAPFPSMLVIFRKQNDKI